MSGIALAHDYVTQRGGAERVALTLTRAFPQLPLHTTLYEPTTTFPEFASIDVRPMPINRWGVLRHHHRLALPFLKDAVSQSHVEADVLVASSSGWAHGIPTVGRKVVYCHAPARWLYQSARYAGNDDRPSLRSRAIQTVAGVMGPSLREWDQKAAHTATRYIVNSTAIKRAVAEVYGIEAEVLPPPPAPDAVHATPESIPSVQSPFVLCVARLLPYKNVDRVIDAVLRIPNLHLAIVGDGPERRRLEQRTENLTNIHLLGRVSDGELRWLYENCSGHVAASYEDFGLTPLEAASCGKPTAALRAGGYLDTVVEGRTGVFFDVPEPENIAAAIDDMTARTWWPSVIRGHADSFSEARFISRIRQIVNEELCLA
ncbi:Glycosyltransferase involved in cell wall bisynthesis [Paramicrobacterium humi]|uniref:D-inositol 3-phosphate glycosyltransferase n=1 Tax=Paramicrobacterium humi TaxID=640635 RepID=A0A1H4MNH4_9MICO|nr:glycosyltransferase [Microbacterium humi]SEB84523.1 Glycosyltransferase involved in cell wall bisynthesis [Microbacterium humi]